MIGTVHRHYLFYILAHVTVTCLGLSISRLIYALVKTARLLFGFIL